MPCPICPFSGIKELLRLLTGTGPQTACLFYILKALPTAQLTVKALKGTHSIDSKHEKSPMDLSLS